MSLVSGMAGSSISTLLVTRGSHGRALASCAPGPGFNTQCCRNKANYRYLPFFMASSVFVHFHLPYTIAVFFKRYEYLLNELVALDKLQFFPSIDGCSSLRYLNRNHIGIEESEMNG
jgi:hypothetical protein